MQKITPFLTFAYEAEEAMNFYLGIFKDAKVIGITRYGKNTPMPDGTVMTANFELFGQKFVALNVGPMFQFTPAISFVVDCEDQAEVDYYWGKLSAGGKPMQCAWLTDKFGVTWQVVPKRLMELMNNPDPAKAGRVMQAMMKMGKIIIADLERAAQD
jgi:predicted 3-demethylubiquinone-9 3-methyltransferase (glyoxalase superfamily)